MKLYKEGTDHWAARAHLDTVDDIDIEVQQYGCGKSMITVRIAFSDYHEGIVSSFDYDGIRVYAYDSHNSFMGSDHLERGCAKLFSWQGRPAFIRFGDITQIPLEYET